MKKFSTFFTVTLVLSMFPLAAKADGAILFKLGSIQLRDDTQILDLTPRNLNAASESTLGVLLEHRFQKSGVGIGVEYVYYRHAYQPQSGLAETATLMVSARKYFIQDSVVRPFIGLGIGIGRTETSNPGFQDVEFTTPSQVVVGLDISADNLSFQIEAKLLHHQIEGGGNEYDPSALGLIASFGFNW